MHIPPWLWFRVAEREWDAFAARVLLTATAVPTATAAPTATLIPTPSPYTVSPGGVEESVGQLYECFLERGEAWDLFVHVLSRGVEFEGLPPEAVERVFESLLEDRNLFVELMLADVAEDGELGFYLAVMSEGMSESCGPEEFVAESLSNIEDDELRGVLGEFFDCLDNDEGVREELLVWLEGRGIDRGGVKISLSDRQFFIQSKLVKIQSEGDASSAVDAFGHALDKFCR